MTVRCVEDYARSACLPMSRPWCSGDRWSSRGGRRRSRADDDTSSCEWRQRGKPPRMSRKVPTRRRTSQWPSPRASNDHSRRRHGASQRAGTHGELHQQRRAASSPAHRDLRPPRRWQSASHVFDERTRPRGMHRVEAALEEIVDETLKLGGTVTGEHGVGLAKRAFAPSTR